MEKRMKQIGNIEGMLSFRSSLNPDTTVGFVPTMGYLHRGHESLIEKCVESADITIVSIFVNPKQFAPHEDLTTYPRDAERDLNICKKHGVDVVFIPENNEVIYPKGFSSRVNCDEGDASKNEKSEAAIRPTFFNGVSTVLMRLFNLIRPTKVFFGQKDAQQCAVVNRLLTDFYFNTIELVVGPIIRENDGLAMSSRNSYLSPDERKRSTVIYRALLKAKEEFIQHSIADSGILKNIVTSIIENTEDGVLVDYVSICDKWTMIEIDGEIDARIECIMCVAAKVGKTRLLDNILFQQTS